MVDANTLGYSTDRRRSRRGWVAATVTAVMVSALMFGTQATAIAQSEDANACSMVDINADWDAVLEGAAAEGAIVIAAPAPQPYQDAIRSAWEAAYPDIALDMTGGSSGSIYPVVRSEKEAGINNWDVLLQPGGGLTRRYLRDGLLDKLDPLVTDANKADGDWVGGFDFGWQDFAGEYVYAYNAAPVPLVRVNRDVVPESELSDPLQLLEPEWKGRIVIPDPRIQGHAGAIGAFISIYGDEEVASAILQQDLQLTSDRRGAAEALVRGNPPVALGVDGGSLAEFQEQGLGQNLELIEGPRRILTDVWGSMAVVGERPHPCSAIVFINWWLSQDGQEAFMSAGGANDHSRRTDVEGPAELAPRPEDVWSDAQPTQNIQDRAVDLAEELLSGG